MFESFTSEEQTLLNQLIGLNQEHLFEKWADSQTTQEQKEKLVEQLTQLNKSYPSGLESYINNAKKLLHESKIGANPYDGFAPEVPEGIKLETGSDQFHQFESIGMKEAASCSYVLVAGGLGERLGYSGIKIALPSDICTNKTFIQLYIESILALTTKSNQMNGTNISPQLAIMTSDDTNDLTLSLLEQNNYFGMNKDNIHILKQEKVPSLIDNNAKFAMDEAELLVETKPHGHGDVHALLHQNNILEKWTQLGKKWVVFFQDTNGLVFNTVPAALGVSSKESFEVNSITVPRRAGEAAGGIVNLKSSKENITINVEYNQLDPLLKSNGQPEGDVSGEDGYSPFPGNINVLVFRLKEFQNVLKQSGGAIPEFINPKYADESRETFKKPTRLECMMQEYPKLLSPSAKVGFTQFERELSFTAVKNNIKDAASKQQQGLPPESASTGECDIYAINRKLLRLAGANIEENKETTYSDITVTDGPKVILSPSFKSTLNELNQKIGNLNINKDSTLILDGENIKIEDCDLHGTLVIKSIPEAKVTIKSLSVVNKGWSFKTVSADAEESLQIRGYELNRNEQRILIFDEAGEYIIEE